MNLVMSKIITLLTDFGLRDPYVSMMKAVILSINPTVKIIDISHKIPKFNILSASFILKSAAKYFPKNTIHVVVIDPGVGSKRRAITIKTKNYYFIGPDNGVLIPAALEDGIVESRNIINKKYFRKDVSKTFHGRDIFAPVAAYLSLGIDFKELGPKIQDFIIPSFSFPRIDKDKIIGNIIHIDDFGNIVTNIKKENIEKFCKAKTCRDFKINIGNQELIVPFLRSYSDIAKDNLLALIDSENYLEISVNMGNAAKMLKAKERERIVVRVYD